MANRRLGRWDEDEMPVQRADRNHPPFFRDHRLGIIFKLINITTKGTILSNIFDSLTVNTMSKRLSYYQLLCYYLYYSLTFFNDIIPFNLSNSSTDGKESLEFIQTILG